MMLAWVLSLSVRAVAADVTASDLVHANARWEPVGRLIDTYNEGVDALNAGALSNARKSFLAVLKAEPGCGVALVNEAAALLRSNEPGLARPYAEAAVAEFPGSAMAQDLLASIDFALQDFPASLAAALRATEIAPQMVSARDSVQRVLIRIGDYDRAEAEIRLGRPSVGDALSDCWLVQLEVDRGDVKKAQSAMPSCTKAEDHIVVRDATQRLALAMGEAVPTGEVGASDLLQGLAASNEARYADAVRLFTRVLRANPKNAEAMLFRALAAANLGDMSSAERDTKAFIGMETWVEVHGSGAMSGILTHGTEVEFRQQVVRSVSRLAALYLQTGRRTEAGSLLDWAEGEFGVGPELTSGRVRSLALEDIGAAMKLAADSLTRWPDAEALVEVVASLAVQRAADVPAALAQAVLAGGTAVDRYNLAVGLANAGLWGRCASTLDQLGPHDATLPVEHLRYHCAAWGSDLAAADRVLKVTDKPSAEDLVIHARHLVDANRMSDALTVLARAVGTDPARASDVDTLMLVAHTGLGQWDAAMAVATKPGVDAGMRANLGIALVEAGRVSDAITVLSGACPELVGQQQSQCQGYLEDLRKR